MGIFASLLAAVTGRTSAPVVPNPNPASPSSIAAKATDPAAMRGQMAAREMRFTPVASSNVAGIKWVPMSVVKRLDTKLIGPGGQVATGPQGGLLPGGGVKVDGTVTAQTVTGYRGDFAPRDQEIPDTALGTLSVMFHSGAVYEYLDVPRRMYTEFSQAASKGRYVHRVLRGWSRYRRVR